MSLIGDFGLCSKSAYNNLVYFIENGQMDKAESSINEMHSELTASASKLENHRCSGEVFIALFEYFNTAFGVNVREDMELGNIGEIWRNATGDFEMIAFSEKATTQLLSLAGTIDDHEVIQFINDFFQNDYGQAGQIACEVFFKNLEAVDSDTVLIFHMY